ncbi:MAG: hypothetical protein ACE5OZ_15265 [Candidatus Heimdallarchaeota archaeon]
MNIEKIVAILSITFFVISISVLPIEEDIETQGFVLPIPSHQDRYFAFEIFGKQREIDFDLKFLPGGDFSIKLLTQALYQGYYDGELEPSDYLLIKNVTSNSF